MQNPTFQQAFSQAFAHIGAAVDIFQSLPKPAANGHTNGTNGHKALPAAAAAPKAPRLTKKAVKKAAAAPATAVVPVKGPGRKAKAAPVVAAPKKKAAVKKTAAPANAIAAGRRAVADGTRPKLVDAMAIVMGKEKCDAGTILERLQSRDWAPGAQKAQNYISYTLSDNPEVFKRVERGVYEVIDPKAFTKVAAQFSNGKPAAKADKPAAVKNGKATSGKAERVTSENTEAPAVASEPVQAQAAAEPNVAGDPPNTEATDSDLADIGLGQNDVEENPFEQP